MHTSIDLKYEPSQVINRRRLLGVAVLVETAVTVPADEAASAFLFISITLEPKL